MMFQLGVFEIKQNVKTVKMG